MADGTAASTTIASADGRALLVATERAIGLGIAERIEIEWTFAGELPADRSEAIDAVRHRRGRLRLVRLLVDRGKLQDRLRARLDGTRFRGIELSVDGGELALRQTAPSGKSVPLARVRLQPGDGRKLELAVVSDSDGRASHAVTQLAAAIGTPFAGGSTANGAVTVDALTAALDEALVAEGFRLPDMSGVRLVGLRVTPVGVLIAWAAADVAADQAFSDEVAVLRRVVERAPSGPERAQAAHALAAAEHRAGDEAAALEALRLCVQDAEPGPLVGDAWRRLVELYARRGDWQSAARALIACADDPRPTATKAERAAALVSAAQILRKRLDLSGDAGLLLERAIALDPASPKTLEVLDAMAIEAFEPARPADVLERRLDLANGRAQEPSATLLRMREHDRLLNVDAGERADPDRDDAYWRGVGGEPAARANHLVATARVAFSRGDTKTAVVEAEAALDEAPRHPPAVALLADIAFRKQDWARARALYAELDQATDTSDAISRELLVRRRASLAARLGDVAEAEALYRELAILNPQHVEARRVLAELAAARGDVPAATARFEEALRLLPGAATAEITELRYRLGALELAAGHFASARGHLELVLAYDPTRVGALELARTTYEALGAHDRAADACGRLARLYGRAAERAEALFRQGEILDRQLGDKAAALDAFLRSSDADPGFVPARLRLVEHFWSLGDLDVVADLANDLADAPLPADSARGAELIARLAIGAAGPRSPIPERFAVATEPTLIPAAARVLAAAGEAAAANTLNTLDPLLTRARFWLGPAGERAVTDMLVDMVRADPGAAGPALALGGLAAHTRRTALARAAYALGAFADPDGLAAKLLETLPPAEPVRPAAVRVGSDVDHPDAAGPSRRALCSLAPALLGFGVEQAAPRPVEGSGLPPARAVELRRIGELLGAPPFVLAPDADTLTKSNPLGLDRRRLRLVPTQPAGLLISPTAATLSARGWSFVSGRAIEALRSGLVTAGLTNAEEMARVLEGARAALRGVGAEDPAAQPAADWLGSPAARLTLGSAEARAELLADVEAALAAPPDWRTFRNGARQTCNRIGVVVCGSPVDALAVIAEGEIAVDDGGAVTAQHRRAFLRGDAARDIVGFLLSPAYEAATTVA
jgi:tetratricopeptide (TPR) repeat protein